MFRKRGLAFYRRFPASGPPSTTDFRWVLAVLSALISAVCLCVLGSRGSGPLGLGPRGPGPAIYGPNPMNLEVLGSHRAPNPINYIGCAWDRFVCPRWASEIKAVVLLGSAATSIKA